VGDDIFVDKKTYDTNFKPRPVDQQILQDKDLSYRVYDASINTFNSASTSYFHKTIGGYHAAKLQRFQDIIDKHIGKGNQKVVDMFNTRYYIVNGQDNKPRVQRNPGAMGNAWLVDDISWVQTPNEEIDALNTIDPRKTAAIHESFRDYIGDLDPVSIGEIKLTTYAPDHLTYSVNANEAALAVFSEVWYGPDKGWQAYLDGQAVDHIRVNYILRGLKLPAGQHTIEFKFEPKAYARGKMASSIFSALILLALLGIIGYSGYSKGLFDTAGSTPGESNKPSAPKRSVKKTSARRKKK
jgi:hypothetical protein